MDSQWFSVAVSAFILWTSLMLVFGPQSALIIKQSVRRQGLVAVLAVVMISDFFLALLGVTGVSALVDRLPWLINILRWGGVLYLLYFAYTCFRDGLRPQSMTAEDVHPTPPVLKGAGEGNEQGLENHGSFIGPSPASSSIDTPDLAELRASGAAGVAVADHRAGEGAKPQSTTWTLVRNARGPALAAFVITWFNPSAYMDSVMLGSLAVHHPGTQSALMVGAMCGTCLWFPFFGFAAHKLSSTLAKPKIWARLNLAIGVIMVLMALRLALSA